MTFDDGPDRGLEAFLGLLEGAGARATFFAVGEQVERDPGRLEEIVASGHEVAVHCYRHRNHLRLTPRQVVEDMRRAGAIIEDAAQRPAPGLFIVDASHLGPGVARAKFTRAVRTVHQRGLECVPLAQL